MASAIVSARFLDGLYVYYFMSDYKFSDAIHTRLSEIKNKYPDARSAVMSALYLVQEEQGYVTDEGIDWISKQLNIPPVHVREVATFYTMYYRKPVGKYHVQVCRTLSCMLCGSKKIAELLREKLHLEPGQVSSDGFWSYEEVECLGSCGTAPMVQINDHFFEKLTPESLSSLLDRITQEKPDLKLSTVKDRMGEGLKGVSKSILGLRS